MKKHIPFVAWGLLFSCGVVLLGREYFKAVRNDLFQVWDVLNELKGAVNEITKRSL